MKEDTRKRLSQLILDELSEKIKVHEALRRKLETFTDLPVEKVADAILNQFEYLLSSDLRDLIVYLIQQDAGGAAPEAAIETNAPETPVETTAAAPEVPAAPVGVREVPEEAPPEAETVQGSIMEHFSTKEIFPTAPLAGTEYDPDDWFYLSCFSYAPDSTGKGVPSKKLLARGIDGESNLVLLDYGDVRFFISKLTTTDLMKDAAGKPAPPPARLPDMKYEHEQILNFLRTEDDVVALPFWTIAPGLEEIIHRIEDRYVELLRALIDIHDASEWDVEIFAFDQHIAALPSIAEPGTGRAVQREMKHQTSKGRNIKILEKMSIREKNIAQDIYSKLLLQATRGKIDFIIRLDNAFIDDWKSILSARYAVGKEKRRAFCQSIRAIQETYAEYRLMFRVTNPGVRFTL